LAGGRLLPSENVAKIALNAVRLPKFEPVNGISWSPRKILVKRSTFNVPGWRDFAHAQRAACMVFNTGPYTVLPDNSILITANAVGNGLSK